MTIRGHLMFIIPPRYPVQHSTKYGHALFGKSEKDTLQFATLLPKGTNLQRVLLASHLLKAPPPIAPCHTASPTHPSISPMPTMVFYRPSYSMCALHLYAKGVPMSARMTGTHVGLRPCFPRVQPSVSSSFITFADSTPYSVIRSRILFPSHTALAGIAIIPTPSPNSA